MQRFRFFKLSALVLASCALTARGADNDVDNAVNHYDGHGNPSLLTGTQLATGQFITPAALRGMVQQLLSPNLKNYPDFIASEAVRAQLSPDGKTLAIITAGHNGLYTPAGVTDTANSTQYLFFYDVDGANKTKPALMQVIPQTNAHMGLIFAPDGKTLYAAGGVDDAVYTYTLTDGTWSLAATIALGHDNKGLGLNVRPNASGLGISVDGKTLVAVNNYNDSISIIDTATRRVRYEHDLRPYFANNEGQDGGVGGTFPLAVVVKGNGTAYVSSDRDREVVVIDIASATAGKLVQRIKLDGNALGMTLDNAQARLYVAQDNADQVAVIDTTAQAVIAKIDARAPSGLLGNPEATGQYTGAGTFAVTLSPDGNALYAVNAGSNSIAVIALGGANANSVIGLIPTAYEPHDITFSADGSWMYIINGKSATGPNSEHLYGNTARLTSTTYPQGNATAAAEAAASNQYQFQLERASLISAPVPSSAELPALTAQVAQNNFYSAAALKDMATMQFLRQNIQHVIYIIKENRTFDQVLGDLNNGSRGDPGLAIFGAGITPNHHNLAKTFVTLDNFTAPGDGSMDGWSWSLQGRVTNMEALTQQINYANVARGLSFESEANNRNVPVNWATTAQRDVATGLEGSSNYSTAAASQLGGAANLLAGDADHAASDTPFGHQRGYIYEAVLAAGGSVRNYGMLVNNVGGIGTGAEPVFDAFAAGIEQVKPLKPSLSTAPYFRGYDLNYPDVWRYNAWKHEFDAYVANGKLPTLSLVRFGHDHTGSFGTALGGFNTPETQVAENDLAVGKLVEAVAHSPYASNTLIFIVEDDCQDGPDHIDSHRSTTYVVGPYVKQGAVVTTAYNQVNLLRTIEDVLGTQHMNLNTAFQGPMTDVFDIEASPAWTYTASASTVLAATQLKFAQSADAAVPFAQGVLIKPTHEAEYWAKATEDFDFSDADRVPPDQYNRVLWQGLKGAVPYPKVVLSQHPVMDDDD
ncbi:MAG: beta-propeller fold lactonase family protein [Pseudomonadales bacterium]|jgi:YVTN family beta-propeller protein|nr:beta-propeller fold lactonase family protein [Pseudomonadales bacterium]